LTKQYKFCAAHRYWNDAWDETRNRQAFGDDVQLHGHNYELDITVTGPISPETGFLVDLMALNKLIQQRVIDNLDHSRIDTDIPWFKNRQPSTEYMVQYIWDQIVNDMPGSTQLVRVRLRETPTIFCEYFGSN